MKVRDRHLVLAGLLGVCIGLYGACGTLVVDGAPVPGEENVTYDGPHDPRDVAIVIAVWRIERDRIIGERPNFRELKLVEADHVNGAGAELGTYDGLCPQMSRCIFEHTVKLSDGPAIHELTHAWLWQETGSPDSDIELTDDGDCLNDGNGECSHAGGSGPWTLLDDEVIGSTNDLLRRMGL